MIYEHPVGLFHVKQPHDSFLTVHVITCVSSLEDQTYSVGLKKMHPNNLLHVDAIVRYFRKT
jgi:hypothetical protein